MRGFLLFPKQYYWQLKGNSYNYIKVTILKMIFLSCVVVPTKITKKLGARYQVYRFLCWNRTHLAFPDFFSAFDVFVAEGLSSTGAKGGFSQVSKHLPEK